MRRVLKWVGFVLLLIVIYIFGSVVNGFYRFDLKFNPIVAEISTNLEGEWGKRSNLIPTVFEKSESQLGIISKLENGGFVQMNKQTLWQRYAKEFSNGTLIFTREANQFPCNINLYVFLQFSKEKQLMSALATQHEHGCL